MKRWKLTFLVGALVAPAALADDLAHPSMDPDSIRGRKAKNYALDRFSSGKLTEADTLYGQCIEAYGRAKDLKEVAWCHGYRGKTRLKLEKLDGALADFEASAKIYRELIPKSREPVGLRNYLADNLRGQHEVFTVKGKHEQAKAAALQWVEVEKAIRKVRTGPLDAQGEARAHVALGASESVLGEHAQAERHFEQAAALWDFSGKGPGNLEYKKRVGKSAEEARAFAAMERAAIREAKAQPVPTAAAPAPVPASGKLVINQKAIALPHAYLFTGPDHWREHDTFVYLLLRDLPLSTDEIAAAESVAELRGSNSILFQVEDPKLSYTIVHDALEPDEILMSSGHVGEEIRFEKLSADHVKGVAKLGHGMRTYEIALDVPFEATLARAFPVAPKIEPGAGAADLGADGGAEGQAYLERCKAQAPPKSEQEVEKRLAAQGQLPTDEDLAAESKRAGHEVTRADLIHEIFEMMKNASGLVPQDCVVLGGKGDGSTAIIDVEATMFETRSRAEVTMTNVDGEWQVKETGPWTVK